MTGFDFSVMSDTMKVALMQVKEIKPDVVVYEHAMNLGNAMHTALTEWNIPGVQLVAMARPETGFGMLTLLGLLVRYPSTFSSVRKIFSLGSQLEPIVGRKMLPES